MGGAVTGSWHLITGEYPPQGGGVADYTALVARALAAAGADVHVWAPPAPAGASAAVANGVHVHRLPDLFGEGALRELTRGLDGTVGPRTLVVQYVPHAFGARGMNLRFCRWVQHRARTARDDVRVMFHEPYYPFAFWPLHRNILALVNRIMAVLLLSDSRIAYVSTRAWQRRLARYAPRARRFVWLPIPASIPLVRDAARVAAWRTRIAPQAGSRVVGHFGTYGALVARLLEPALALLLQQHADLLLCLIGPGSEAFASRLCANHADWRERITAAGRLSAPEVSACLQACDVVVQPYADGASGRRTTLMAALINEVPVVTNRGRATEVEWTEGDAVALAPRAHPQAICDTAWRVIEDDALRGRLAQGGASLYARRFAVTHTVHALLAGQGAP
ncbi:MAG TPA: glycosyltransferase [Gemmatimonadaceae bacterium]|nr:glycosyltransferase [Gemmatimonadaceae bacterium]